MGSVLESRHFRSRSFSSVRPADIDRIKRQLTVFRIQSIALMHQTRCDTATNLARHRTDRSGKQLIYLRTVAVGLSRIGHSLAALFSSLDVYSRGRPLAST